MTNRPANPADLEAAIRQVAPTAWVNALDQRQAEDAENRRGRGGRPKAPDPKIARVTMRFTESERALLSERAGPRGIAEYLRSLGLGRRSRLPRQVPPINAEAWAALAPVVANLNQLARRANEGGNVDVALIPVLSDIRQRVMALRAALLGRNESDDQDSDP